MTMRTTHLIHNLIRDITDAAERLLYRRDWPGAAEALNEALGWEMQLMADRRRWAY